MCKPLESNQYQNIINSYSMQNEKQKDSSNRIQLIDDTPVHSYIYSPLAYHIQHTQQSSWQNGHTQQSSGQSSWQNGHTQQSSEQSSWQNGHNRQLVYPDQEIRHTVEVEMSVMQVEDGEMSVMQEEAERKYQKSQQDLKKLLFFNDGTNGKGIIWDSNRKGNRKGINKAINMMTAGKKQKNTQNNPQKNTKNNQYNIGSTNNKTNNPQNIITESNVEETHDHYKLSPFSKSKTSSYLTQATSYLTEPSYLTMAAIQPHPTPSYLTMAEIQPYPTPSQSNYPVYFTHLDYENQYQLNNYAPTLSEPDLYYSFNNLSNYPITLHQTPAFRNSLRSPFFKFNQQSSAVVQELWGPDSLHPPTPANDQDCTIRLDLDADPLLYIKENPLAYFMGIGNKLREDGNSFGALFFYRIASYINPLAARPWIKAIDVLAELGRYSQAMHTAKTSFLFKPHSVSAEDYLKMGDKAKMPMHELRGILPALKNIDKNDSIVYECARLEMKNRKFARGLILLSQYCWLVNYRSNFAYGIVMLLRQLENYCGYKDLSHMQILVELITGNGCVKYDVLSMYLDYVRYFQHLFWTQRSGTYYQHDGNLSQFQNYFESPTHLRVMRRLKKYKGAANILYKFYMEIGEIYLFNQMDGGRFQKCQKCFKLAYQAAEGSSNKTKACMEIYLKASMLGGNKIEGGNKIQGGNKIEGMVQDLVMFQNNKIAFIKGQKLQEYVFSDWKYYLHYGADRNYQKLMEASQMWPNTGRLTCECIHVLRMQKRPLAMLKLWRQQIEKIPKAGQLWCQAGRIYANLGQEKNALKCFQAALHFTPQYGDTFFQLLLMYLKQNRFYEIQKLKKNFYVTEPYIGNVLSFLRNSNRRKLSSYQIWEAADKQIRHYLYSCPAPSIYASVGHNRLTAVESYNQAVLNPVNEQIRQRLFCSFEQFQGQKN